MAKMGKGWLKRGRQKKRFNWKDYTYLVGKGGKTNTQIMDRLWDNQERLHSKNLPGKGRGSVFDRIQRKAQKDWQASTGWNPMSSKFNSSGGVDDWNFGLWGNQEFGEEDIKTARKAGASKYQIGQLYARAKEEGLHSRGAREWIKERNVPESDWDYGAHGGWDFDMKDIKAMRKDDYGLDQIIEARDWADKHGLTIGEKVVGHIQKLEDKAAAQTLKEEQEKQKLEDEAAVQAFQEDKAAYQALKEEVKLQKLEDKAAVQALKEEVKLQKLEDKAAARSLKADVRWGEKRDKIFQNKIEKTQAATMQKTAAAAEAGRIASMRGMGSQRLGASGAAIFKNKGLTSLGKGKGGGTSQFTRPSNHWPVHKLL